MSIILFIDNTAHHLYTQAHLYSHLKRCGFRIVLAAPSDGKYFNKLQNMGYTCIHIGISAKGINPLTEIILLWRLKQLVRKVSPALILTFTIKPNLYILLLCRWLLHVHVLPNITGLGTGFLDDKWLNKVIIYLYKLAFKKHGYVFFQNDHDLQTLVSHGIINNPTHCIMLPGDGVDLRRFKFMAQDDLNSERRKFVIFLYSGRLLRSKGLFELVEAYRIVLQQFPMTKLWIIGNYDIENVNSVSQNQIVDWETDPGIIYMGMVDDVPSIIAQVDCGVLPSYYMEGIPRASLEIAATGRAVITTDWVGCRDTIDDRVTGFLCKVQDVKDLADKMIQFIELTWDHKIAMGLAAREKIERGFDQQIVVNKYMEAIQQLIPG